MKSRDQVIRDINKAHGDDAVILGTQMRGQTLRRITSGVLGYDAVFGGGFPVNKWHEIVGLESGGKTLLAQSTVVANQRRDPNFETLWIASEDVNYEWCETVGMDLDRVEFVPGNIMEQAFDIAIQYMENRLVDLVVIDSLPALIPTSEDERGIDELSIGKSAILNNKFFVRKSPRAMKRSLTEPDRACTGLVINQWRDKIGAPPNSDPRTTNGGRGKNFAYYIRAEMTRVEWIREGKKPVGGRFRVRTMKNKSAPTNRAAEVSFYFDAAGAFSAGTFDHADDLMGCGLYYDLFGSGGGGSYRFGEHRWKGKEAVLDAIRQDFDLQEEIAAAVLQLVNPAGYVAPKRKTRLVRG